MHLIVACLCNSRIAQPGYAGHASTWPLALLWGGQGVAAVSACLFVVARRRRRSAADGAADSPPAALAAPDEAGVEHEESRA